MENKDTREKKAEEYIHSNWEMAQDVYYTTPVITADQALEAIRLSKIEALEESHNKISALSSLAHISDAQAILYNQITELKNG